MRKPSHSKRNWIVLLVGLAALVGFYYLPPVHSRLAWRLDELWNKVRLSFDPPDQAVFVPGQGLGPDGAVTSSPEPTRTLGAFEQATPTVTIPPIPASVRLPGVVYVDQMGRWNYCGPSNLSMALNFWGWTGNRDDVAMVVRPGRNDPSVDFIQRGRTDLNVRPEELEDFTNEHTGFRALWRYGGDVELVKRLIAAGFPLIVEKGYVAHDTTGNLSWMGHYEFVTGYDENSLLVQDAYDFGPDYSIPSDEFAEGWRAFNYLFFIVYPPDREAELFDLLGAWSDPAAADQIALQRAVHDTGTLSSLGLFFAWFDVGTSQLRLGYNGEAAASFDHAFQLYAALGDEITYRPYRLLWYQFGPYEAYYLMGRFQDVIDLADNSLSTPLTGPTLEESLYWRSLAEYALANHDSAYADMRQAIYLNPNFKPALEQMAKWGISP